MSKIKTVHTGTFSARDPIGNEYVIYVFTEMRERRTLDKIERIPGLKILKTSEGEAVNLISHGVYDVLAGLGDVRVTSDSPDAP